MNITVFAQDATVRTVTLGTDISNKKIEIYIKIDRLWKKMNYFVQKKTTGILDISVPKLAEGAYQFKVIYKPYNQEIPLLTGNVLVEAKQVTPELPVDNSLVDVFSVDDPSLPLEYIKKTKSGQTTTVTQLVKPSGLVYGGNLSYVSGLTFRVKEALYFILKTPYQSPETTKTCDPADPALPRRDVFAVTTDKTVIILKGVPSENPVKPVINPETMVELTDILIEAGATTPSGIVSDVIYNENDTWVGSGNAVFNSVRNPKEGVLSTEGTNMVNGNSWTWTRGVKINSSLYSQISMYWKSKATITSNQNIYVSFWNDAVMVGTEQLLTVNKTSLVYQLITMDLVKFGVTGLINKVRFRWVQTGKQSTHAGFNMDVVRLEAIGIPQTVDYQWICGSTGSTGVIEVPILNGRKVHFAHGTNLEIVVTEHATLGHVLTFNATGVNAYVYIAYASAIDGTGFTMTNNPALDYMAVLNSAVEIPAPVVGDFVGLWYKRVGEDGVDGIDGTNGVGVPTGGTTGQKLVKHSNTNYDTKWKDDLSIFDIEFEYADLSTRTAPYVLDLKASFAYTIVSAVLQTDAGTCTAAFKIDGTNITSLSAVGATTTITETNATGANTVSAGQLVTLTVSSVVTATRLAGKLKIQR